MKFLCNSVDTICLKPNLYFSSKPFSLPKTMIPNKLNLRPKPIIPTLHLIPIRSFSSSASPDIDMVKNKQGVYAPKDKKVVVLWDLDNKPPRGPPYVAAMELRGVAEKFGDVVEISAYANRHAFIHVPRSIVEERRERRQVDVMERKGILKPSEPYVCGVCGRKCKTNLDLKKHFRQLHERERNKKLNRMRSLKGKKRQRYKERYISGNYKYNEAARDLIMPKVGYGLGPELRRAGVYVKTVEDKPQAADWALKRQMQHSMHRGIDWLVLVSDDKDFKDMLRKAREADMGTVVVGDCGRGLGRNADLWIPWSGVENGEITEEDLVLGKRRRRAVERVDDDEEEEEEYGDGLFSVSYFGEGVNQEVFGASNGVRGLVFSEEEDWVEEGFSDGEYLLEVDGEDEEDDGFL